MRPLLLALIATLAAGAPVFAASAESAPPVAKQSRDWVRNVVQTPEGGWRMGNPNAAIKVIEYGSISCSHCADFSSQSATTLRAQVRAGRVSFEYRPFMIFPSDPGIFMLMACGGSGNYFETADRLYALQPEWLARLQANESQFRGLPLTQMLGASVRAAGLIPFFRQRGLSEQQINACLANQAGLGRLTAAQQRFNRLNITGTPTFYVNGQQVDGHDWASLAPHIR